jgi:hypothetical protein
MGRGRMGRVNGLMEIRWQGLSIDEDMTMTAMTRRHI